MRIQFYRNNSDPEVLAKDIVLLRDGQGNIIGNYDGFLKEKSSIVSPSFMIETTDTGEEFPWERINYFFVPSWGRYYYITDVTVVRTHLYQITGRVDVLMSFRTELGACSGIVANNENDWNMYLDDGSCRVYQNPHTFVKVFPNWFGNEQIALAVAGAGSPTTP